jgi:hypothetical protein
MPAPAPRSIPCLSVSRFGRDFCAVAMNQMARRIQRTYLAVMVGNTLAPQP